MRLTKLAVSGFRGFASSVELDLDADAIVIIGSNGLGKTSFLDAIHWALCGRLDRISNDDSNLVSMYSETGRMRVTLTLAAGDRELTIIRSSDGTSQVLQFTLDDQTFKGASAVARLLEKLWPEAAMAADGPAAFSMGLERAIYLQQDRLRDFLEAASDQERFDAVSQLMGAGNLTEFQSQLESESRSWKRSSNQFRDGDLFAANNRVDSLKGQLSELENLDGNAAEFHESRWTDWWSKAIDLNVATAMPLPTSQEASSVLDKAIRQTHVIRNQALRRQSQAKDALQMRESEPDKPTPSLAALEEALRSIRKEVERTSQAVRVAQTAAAEARQQSILEQELHEQRRALAQLALGLLEDKCPVCLQDYDLERTRERLKALTSSDTVELPPVVTKSEVEVLLGKEAAALAEEEKINAALKEAQFRQKEYDAWLLECETATTALKIDPNKPVVAQLRQIFSDADVTARQLESLGHDGESLALDLATAAAAVRIHAVRAELALAEQTLANDQHTLKKREYADEVAKALIEQLRDARSKIAIDKLEQLAPLMQKIYSRIDPHPAFRVVRFVTDMVRGKGRLNAIIHDSLEGKSSSSPQAILSSSQLNAMALSIFLTLNLSLPEPPLQLLLLDDPIQSLDDINLLGLVDLLRRVKARRQVIVSTHDLRFGRLMARKLRPTSEAGTTSVVELRGWQRTGPAVRQYLVNADTALYKIAASM